MATIRNLATGQLLDGPDGEPTPEGYERVGGEAPVKAAAAPTTDEGPGYLARTMTRGGERAKEIATFPLRVGRLVTGHDKPQSIEDVALLAMGNAPLIAGSGGLAALTHLPKLAPLARIAASFGLAKGRGEDTTTAAIEALGAGTAEAGMGVARKALAGPARALEPIIERIAKQKGWIGHRAAEKKLTGMLDDWKADPNTAVRAQRADTIAAELRKIDPTGEAARIFTDQIAKGAKLPFVSKTLPPAPLGLSRVAEALTGPAGRSGADALMSADPLAPAAAAYGLTQMPESVMRLVR